MDGKEKIIRSLTPDERGESMTIKSIRRILIAFSAVLVLLLSVTFQSVKVYAAESSSVQANFESQNVSDDLEGATIAGKPFEKQDYSYNSDGSPQVLSLVEFCYSYDSARQSDFGLYLYIYNPQGLAFDTSPKNQIQLIYGDNKQGSKFGIEMLNYSQEVGYEGRFYKFKVQLSDEQRSDILQSLNADSRVYTLVEVELSYKGTVRSYVCGQTYTYNGYAEGYGSELASSDTLSCTVDGFETYLSLDVRSTYWRPDGTHSDGYTKDTLHSVYFSVPNAMIEKYGEMTAVHATWLNAYTAPIFVTGNRDVYDAFMPYLGKYVNGGSYKSLNANNSIGYAAIATKAADEGKLDVPMASRAGYYAYNNYISTDGEFYGEYDNQVYYLNYLFYADGGNADEFVLSSEKLLAWLETFTAKFSGVSDGDGGIEPVDPDNNLTTGADPGNGSLVDGRYSKALFSSVDSQYTDVTLSSDDEYKMTDNVVSNSVWDRLFGNELKTETSYNISAIQKVTGNDVAFYSSPDVFCDTFYIADSDYEDFCNYLKVAESEDSTVYLFRYYQSEYVSNEATEYKRIVDWSLFEGNFGSYEALDTNAYFAQTWVQLGFDIIDLTFTKNDASTIVPVVMTPQDIAPGVEPPAHTVSEGDDGGLEWWQILLGVIAFIIIIAFLYRLLPVIIYLILWLISGGLKLIGSLFKSLFSRRKRDKYGGRNLDKMSREEVEKELDQIDWDSDFWKNIDGTDGG